MSDVHVALVVARARNGVIGRENGLPWRLKADMAHFKTVTMGKPVIMGRNTWGSLPRKPLPGRLNIVITRNAQYMVDGAAVATSIDDAIRTAKQHAMKDGVNEICIIGGAQIYAAGMPYATKIYLTEVNADIEGDAHFNVNFENDWAVESKTTNAPDDQNEFEFSFINLVRKAAT
ncbi:MAG: dihydrofolate reductase [Alphaproteobacteria bacterium]|nr:dihydrofolate reductase [Alphaproteobacteria bacterium]MBV8549437.1 dihydrofolate reductase [Alphaproteobacteria bacterium]